MEENMSEPFYFFRKQIQLHCCKRRAYFVRIVNLLWTKVTFNLRRLFTRLSTQAHVRQAADIHFGRNVNGSPVGRSEMKGVPPTDDIDARPKTAANSKNDDLPLIKSQQSLKWIEKLALSICQQNDNEHKKNEAGEQNENKTNEQFFRARSFHGACKSQWRIISSVRLGWLNFDLYIFIMERWLKRNHVQFVTPVTRTQTQHKPIGYATRSAIVCLDLKFDWPLNVCTMLLLIMCHSWASPTLGVMTRCCLDGANIIDRIGPVPDTVIVRICDGNGTGSHPVNGTNNGTVYPSHQAVAERTVMLSNELSFSACSDIGRSQEINCNVQKLNKYKSNI